MSRQWHVAVNGEKKGTFSEDEIRAKVQAGQLDRNAHVFTDGMTDWVLLGSRPEFSVMGGGGARDRLRDLR